MNSQELHDILITFVNTLIHMNTISQITEDTSNLIANLTFNRQGYSSAQGNNKNNNQGIGQSGNRGNGRAQGNCGRSNYYINNGSKPHAKFVVNMGFQLRFAITCSRRSFFLQTKVSSGQIAAYIAIPEVVADPNWLVDSGTSNHVTPDLSNLKVQSDYYHCW